MQRQIHDSICSRDPAKYQPKEQKQKAYHPPGGNPKLPNQGITGIFVLQFVALRARLRLKSVFCAALAALLKPDPWPRVAIRNMRSLKI
jgi:hypothetical protein